MNDEITKAVAVLRNGGIVIFPTDTAFGIGCRIDDENAVKRLFEIRKRPPSQATPVLINGLEMANNYLRKVPEDVISKLIKPYWPGALTIVLNCKENKVPDLVRGGGKTLGVRMPNNSIILSIIEKLGVAVLGPSANFHTSKTPYVYKDLDKNLLKLVDYVISGECMLKKASTVIDCSVNPWKILRIGALDIKI